MYVIHTVRIVLVFGGVLTFAFFEDESWSVKFAHYKRRRHTVWYVAAKCGCRTDP